MHIFIFIQYFVKNSSFLRFWEPGSVFNGALIDVLNILAYPYLILIYYFSEDMWSRSVYYLSEDMWSRSVYFFSEDMWSRSVYYFSEDMWCFIYYMLIILSNMDIAEMVLFTAIMHMIDSLWDQNSKKMGFLKRLERS